MSIQIIDGFKLGVSKPVDDRMVTSGTSSRNDIAYKYEGLRVFDISQKLAFVWIDGQWKKESEVSVASGVIPGLEGTTNKVVKFIDTNKIGDSSIYDNGFRVGIGTTNPDTTVRLHVDGNVKATSFKGVGTYLTEIDANNITSGKLALTYLTNGSSGQVLISGASSPQWANLSTLSPSSITVTNDTTATANHYISFTSVTTGSAALKVNSTGLIFNPSKGQILLDSGSAAFPSYSFADNGYNNTGIYQIANEKSLGFSTDGTVKMVIKAGGNVGIGTDVPYTSLHIVGQVDDTNSSGSNTAGQIFLSDTNSVSQGLSLGYAYYPTKYEYARIQTQGNFSLVLQEKGGVVKIGQVSNYYDFTNLLDVNGQTRIRGAAIVGNDTGDAQIKVGLGRTSNGNTFIDLVSETTGYTDYGLRFIRWGSDPSILGVSQIVHKGTQRFDIIAEQDAPIIFYTSNAEKIRITNQGISVQNGTVAAPSYYFGGETSTGIYRAAANTVGISTGGTVAMQIGDKVVINKTLNIPADPGPGKILTSNASGDASWTTPVGIPPGTIVMWISGPIPTDWYICDGSGGRPDLRDRFIIGAGTVADVGSGGSGSPTSPVSVSTSITIAAGNLPKHTHGVGTFAATTSESGLHVHQVQTRDNGNGENYVAESGDNDGPKWIDNQIGAAGAHTHTVTISGNSGDGGFANTPIQIYAGQEAKTYSKLVFIIYMPAGYTITSTWGSFASNLPDYSSYDDSIPIQGDPNYDPNAHNTDGDLTWGNP